MAIHLPQPKQVKDLLGELLGRDVTLTPATPYAPGPDEPTSIALYVDDRLNIVAVIACDLKLSAAAAAAIGLVPPTGADAAVSAGLLTDTLAENLYEILNIAASVFNVEGADHVRLHAVHPAGPTTDPQLRLRVLTLGRREDLSVDIAGYGAGRLSIVLV